MSEEIIINRINKELKIPNYATDGSVGIDLTAREDIVIPCNPFVGKTEKILLNILELLIGEFDCLKADETKELIEELSFSFGFKRTMIPLNIQVKYPDKKWGLLVPRGSLYKEKGIVQANMVGIIDTDFCKEHWFPAINLTNKDVLIKKGEAICQLIFLNHDQVQLIEGEVPQHENHNGDASTKGYKK